MCFDILVALHEISCLEVWALRGKGFEGLHTDQSGRHRPEVDHGAEGTSGMLNKMPVNK